MFHNLKNWLKSVYHQLVEIHDTPHRKALGLGLGVFLGIFPGMGPIASVVLAALLKVNKATALLGSVVTNTWISVVTLGLALKIGSWFSKTDMDNLKKTWEAATKEFNWEVLGDLSLWKTLGGVAAGFFVISFMFALSVYIAALVLLTRQQQRHAAKIS